VSVADEVTTGVVLTTDDRILLSVAIGLKSDA